MEIIFEKGLIGLEQYKKYDLKELEGNPVFNILESMDNKEISFAVVSPSFVKEDYKVDKISEERLMKSLKTNDKEDLVYVTIVSINKDIKKMTTNLRAPIAINRKNHKGEQIVLNNENYLVKYPLIKG